MFGHKGEERDSVNMVRMRGSFDIVRIGVRLIRWFGQNGEEKVEKKG